MVSRLTLLGIVFLLYWTMVSGQTLPPQGNTTGAPPVTVPPPATVPPSANATGVPPVTGAPPGNATGGPPVATPLPGNITVVKVGLEGICLSDENCAVANSACVSSVFADGLTRCRCKDGYVDYYANSEQSCLQYIKGNDPKCQACQNNGGECLNGTSPDGYVCSCPSSQSGKDCEKTHVTVQCVNESMIICYTPHDNVNIENGEWSLYTAGHADQSQCVGTTPGLPEYCGSGNSTLASTSLRLSLNTSEILICGTQNTKDTQNNQFSNSIIVAPKNSSAARQYVFNVYCSFQVYSLEKYAGVGMVSPNGNDRGVQVVANLSLNVVDAFSRTLPEGSSLLVGDLVKFRVTLTKDSNYYNLQVLTCIASSMFIMPTVNAETRTLMYNGCPIKGDPVASNFYWTVVPSPDINNLTLETKNVPMFRMPSSNFVYFYCVIKLCLISNQGDCAPKTEASCNSQILTRRKRSAVPDYWASTSTGFRVYEANANNPDPNGASRAVGGSVTTVIAIVFGVLAALVIIGIIVGAAILITNKRDARAGRQERFAMQRLRNTHQRF